MIKSYKDDLYRTEIDSNTLYFCIEDISKILGITKGLKKLKKEFAPQDMHIRKLLTELYLRIIPLNEMNYAYKMFIDYTGIVYLADTYSPIEPDKVKAFLLHIWKQVKDIEDITQYTEAEINEYYTKIQRNQLREISHYICEKTHDFLIELCNKQQEIINILLDKKGVSED